MYVEHEFFIGFRDIDFKSNLTIKSMLSFLEDIAGIHSNMAGYGLLDIPKQKKTWMLSNWKVEFKRRPHYSETLKVRTWGRNMDKLYAYRDFEVFDEKGEIVAIATSKWFLVDIENLKIAKLDDDARNAYTLENKNVFEGETEKLKDPGNYHTFCKVQIDKTMIDLNGHVHNLNYIDFATHVLPYEIMQKATKVEVMYKKEIKENSVVKCFYAIKDDYHYVVIKSEDENTIHAIIKIG